MAAVVAVLALAGCSSDESGAVELGTVTRGTVVETVAAPATMEPRDRVTVSSPATGTVAELLVADGDEVAAGDALLRLESPSVETSIAQAQAAVDAADALAGIATGVDLSPVIGAVRQQLESVIPELLGQLTQQANVLPDAQREQAFDAIRGATQAYDRTVAGLADAEQQAAAAARRATASQQAAAAAQRQQAEVALEAARSRADDLTVTAPAPGVVELTRGGASGGLGAGVDVGAAGTSDLGDLSGLLGGGATSTASGPVAVGSDVTAGQSLLTVFDLSAFRAAAEVDEIDVVDVAVDQPVTVLVDAFPDAQIPGHVEHVSIEPTTGAAGGVTYAVTIALDDVPDGVALRVGLSGSAEITTRTVTDALVVPSSALRRRGETDVVYVARDGVLHETGVVVEAIGEDTAAVTGELDVGDRIVTSGLEAVADGDPVPS